MKFQCHVLYMSSVLRVESLPMFYDSSTCLIMGFFLLTNAWDLFYCRYISLCGKSYKFWTMTVFKLLLLLLRRYTSLAVLLSFLKWRVNIEFFNIYFFYHWILSNDHVSFPIGSIDSNRQLYFDILVSNYLHILGIISIWSWTSSFIEFYNYGEVCLYTSLFFFRHISTMNKSKEFRHFSFCNGLLRKK